MDNMSKLLILTIGFDEKFPLRAVMRRGISKGDVILLITATPIEERVKKAINMFKRMVLNIAEDVKISVLEVPVENLVKSVRLIRKEVERIGVRRIEVNLSGGMRILIIATLLALSPFTNSLDIPIEMELEDGRAITEVKLKWFKVPTPGYEDVKIMKAVETLGITTLDTLIKHLTAYPRSTLHRKLVKLVEMGFLIAERRGKRVYYKLSELGMMYI